jgi:Tol biopolymer transport system component
MRPVQNIAVIILLLFPSALAVFAQDIDTLKAGVVRIRAVSEGASRSGTGFIVSLTPDTAYIVTASHVVAGDNAPQLEFFTRRNILISASVVGLEGSDPRGLALLLVKGKENLPPGLVALPLVETTNFRGGEKTIAIGFPRMAGPWSVINADVIAQSGRHIVFSGAIEEGSSGSALIQDGRVVGLVTDLGNPYGSAIPAATVQLFLQGFGVKPSAKLLEAKIAFMSDRDGNREIYVMDADGSNVTRLTNNPAVDDYPAWSPDGKRIAFQSEREGSEQIYIMNADGKNLRRLTAPPGKAYFPSWSPDGSKIVFSAKQDGSYQIVVTDADGASRKPLVVSDFRLNYPSWSPDGSKIAYSAHGEGKGTEPALYVMNSDGTKQTLLSLTPTKDWGPSWSPDGTQIVFESMRDFETSNEPPLTVHHADNSTDTYYTDFNIEIYIMNSDGRNATRLTNNKARDFTPAVSRDGKKIAFASNRDWSHDGKYRDQESSYSEIYVMNVDGTAPIRLTRTRAHNSSPSWSPLPR